jgi:hypothetical protein
MDGINCVKGVIDYHDERIPAIGGRENTNKKR